MKKRFLSAVLAALMLISLIPVSAFAETKTDYIEYINPLYADILSAQELNISPRRVLAASAEVSEYKSFSEVAIELREAMVRRDASVILYLKAPEYNSSTLLTELVEAAIVHTGVGNEGDYLKWTHGRISGKTEYSVKSEGNADQYCIKLSLNCTYLTSAEEESFVEERINEIIGGFELPGDASDYRKIKAAYDYVCANVSYDYVHDDSYDPMFTAYGALYNGSAVCQGFAALMYDLLLHMGVDCRIITSDYHGWNIVKLDDVYYNIDSTWDAGKSPESYRWFLKCRKSFTSHTRTGEYDSAEFNALYPMSQTDFDYYSMHNWDGGTVTRGATCTEAGEFTYRCTDVGCTESVTEPIPALGHEPGEWAQAKIATCSEYGEESSECQRCHTTLIRNTEKAAHSYADGVCTVCGAKENTSFLAGFLSFFINIFARMRSLFLFSI